MTEEPGQENPAKPNGHTWIRWCTTIAIAAAIFFLATLVAQPARLVVDFPQVHRAISEDLPRNHAEQSYTKYGFTPRIIDFEIEPLRSDQVNAVNIEIYSEAQCKYSTQFIISQLLPVWNRLSPANRINVRLIPFGKAKCEYVNNKYQCTCQHGQNECELNTMMNCVIGITLDDPTKYVPIIGCLQGKKSITDATEKCLADAPKYFQDRLTSCTSSEEGKLLLLQAANATARLDLPLKKVPLVIINGEVSSQAVDDLLPEICKRLMPVPEQCIDS